MDSVWKAAALIAAGALVWPGSARAQVFGSGGGQTTQQVHVTVQLMAPTGGPLQENVRITLIAEDAHRPPEDFFTDSRGAVIFSNLRALVNYAILVPGDGVRWRDTRVPFTPVGRRMTVPVQLEPMLRAETVKGPATVSAYTLKQNVPRAARREFDSAVSQLEKQQHAAAQKHLQEALRIYPNYVQALNELAVLLMRDGQMAQAETHLRHALSIDNAALRPLLNLGLCLLRQEKYAAAVETLERATQLDPAHPRAHLLLGSAYLGAGDEKSAERALTRAYELGGASVARANLELARIYARAGLYDRAVAALTRYLEDVPDDPNSAALQQALARLRAASRS